MKQDLLKYLKAEGFSDKIIKAFSKISRENFISSELEHLAYKNTALPIGKSQTISQPYTIAAMLELLDIHKGQKILEVGSGCGYVLALLSELVGESGKIYGIEIVKELYDKSKENLKKYKNVHLEYGNGRSGLIEYAPYDRILISAACEKFPEQVLKQLKPNGTIVAPINDKYDKNTQELIALNQDVDKLITKKHPEKFSFVPFIEN